MARFSFHCDASNYFADLLAGSEDLQWKAVEEGGKMLKIYTAQTGRSMLVGPYATGETVAGLVVKRGNKGISTMVTYEGYHSYGDYMHGFSKRRLGEVAFLNEYGARGKAAREFNRKAVEDNETAIVQAMADIIFEE